ncbi:nucleolus protein [Russula earlei]|uniref:Nucleolus protein n=1 Tax=Russula earlei TaxID=71964 RepID=A0ACC0UF74_9AGAM|nr:nucleolus protein [Russula earlei]
MLIDLQVHRLSTTSLTVWILAMPKVYRRRKRPVTLVENRGTSGTPRASRTVIRKFHRLLKQQKSARGDTLANVNREIEELGGLERYQRMSCIGQGMDRGGGSEKVLIEWMKQMGWADRKEKGERRHRLLEVGAVKPDNYRGCTSWLDATAIDLRSRHPSILEQDFLLMDQSRHREAWDVISLSLVLNFVPDGKDRGRMLVQAHSMIRPGGLCFLALPLPCVNNSRYMTSERMGELMDAVGFSRLEERWRPGGKMIYWLYRRRPTPEKWAGKPFGKKEVLRQGGSRNNFHILLQRPTAAASEES